MTLSGIQDMRAELPVHVTGKAGPLQVSPSTVAEAAVTGWGGVCGRRTDGAECSDEEESGTDAENPAPGRNPHVRNRSRNRRRRRRSR